ALPIFTVDRYFVCRDKTTDRRVFPRSRIWTRDGIHVTDHRTGDGLTGQNVTKIRSDLLGQITRIKTRSGEHFNVDTCNIERDNPVAAADTFHLHNRQSVGKLIISFRQNQRSRKLGGKIFNKNRLNRHITGHTRLSYSFTASSALPKTRYFGVLFPPYST